MNRYRHLFFDLDSTLWDFDRNSPLALKETFRKYNLDLRLFDRFYEVYSRYNNTLWELYRRNGITKQELTRSRFELTFTDTGITGIDGSEFNNDYLDLLPEQTLLCAGAKEVLEKLSMKAEMHIITNGFSEVQYRKMANSGIRQFFKRIFVSEEIKSNKPSPEIFRYAMKACNARKKECLMIGDSWEVDIIGAMQTGMDQIWYNPVPDEKQVSEAESYLRLHSKTTTYRIIHLEELLTIL
jgi:putative hydrolase of the HAD superfamily